MAQVGNLVIEWPKIGCCSPVCGGTCPACCDNVQYDDLFYFNLTNPWVAAGDGIDDCAAGSDSTGPFALSPYYAVFNHEIEDWGPVIRQRPCEWQWEVGRPMSLTAGGAVFTPACGDVTVQGACIPVGFGGKCFIQTFKVTRARFFSVCKVPPQDPESPYADMPQIGDNTTEPASCTVTAGTSKAGWCGEISITSEADCTDPAVAGHATCSIAYLVNTRGVGLFPGDPTGYMSFGPCASGGLGCDPWRCCDPFAMRFYLGSWVFQLPDPNFLTQTTPDYFQCEPTEDFPNGIAHQADVDYDLGTIPFLDVSASHTCIPSGAGMMAKVARMSDTEVDRMLRRFVAQGAA